MADQSPFDRWYAANCLLAKNASPGALREAWNAAIGRAVKECGRVRAVDGADAVTRCRERVAELGK